VLQTVVLARVLGPEAFGAMAIVAGFLAVLSMFSDLGMSKALVHFDSLSPALLSNLYWCTIAVSIGVALVFALCAPLLASGFNYPGLAGVMTTSCLVFPITAIGQQFRTLAEKDLRFRELAISEIAAALSGLLIGIALALRDAGPYALLGSVLASALINSAYAWLFLRRGWWPSRWVTGLSMGRHLRYGAYLMGDGLTNTARMQADILIAGAVAGSGAVGFYTVARDLALRVSNSLLNPIITRVSLPLMAQIQADRQQLKRAYLITIQMVSLVNFPIYVALGLYASEVVNLLYGAAWQGASDFLRLFAIWGLIRSVGNPSGSLLYATGYARLAFVWNAYFLILIPPILFLGAMMKDLQGLAGAMLLTQALFFVVGWKVFVKRACGATLREYIGSMMPALMSALLSGGCAFLSTLRLEDPVLRLAVGSSCGAAAYLAISVVINRRACSRLLQLLPPISRMHA
jgi:O-antigen/teichoic acid export membrane protein